LAIAMHCNLKAARSRARRYRF